MKPKIELRVLDEKLLSFDIKPATVGSAAVDLRPCMDSAFILAPGDEAKVGSGLAIALPPGLAAFVLPRSGLGSEGLVIGNLVGLIDSDYRGEIFLSLWNRSRDMSFQIEPYTRIAQLLVIHYHQPDFNFVPQFTTLTDRGENGGGSTGIS